jgi:hypothetical protein
LAIGSGFARNETINPSQAVKTCAASSAIACVTAKTIRTSRFTGSACSARAAIATGAACSAVRGNCDPIHTGGTVATRAPDASVPAVAAKTVCASIGFRAACCSAESSQSARTAIAACTTIGSGFAGSRTSSASGTIATEATVTTKTTRAAISMSAGATCKATRTARTAITGSAAVSTAFSREGAVRAKSTVAAIAAQATITGIPRPRRISSDTTIATIATVIACAAVTSVAAVTFSPVDTGNTGHTLDSSALATLDGAAVLNLQWTSGNSSAALTTLAAHATDAAHATQTSRCAICAVCTIQAVCAVFTNAPILTITPAATRTARTTHATISAVAPGHSYPCGDLQRSVRAAISSLPGSSFCAIRTIATVSPIDSKTSGAAIYTAATRAAIQPGRARRGCNRHRGISACRNDTRGIKRGP